ncbi:hypothetical protein [Paenibacillus catalpae]|uniref:hypothetical protein n=1 Tax=Paenibacillus catalpae TaxID=1045775 RepID=UPI000AC9B8E4|nr:hypothetical protein [Paenibacillus catalpae]
MRLLIQTGLCLVVLWFGLLGAGPVTERQGWDGAYAGLTSEVATAAGSAGQAVKDGEEEGSLNLSSPACLL